MATLRTSLRLPEPASWPHTSPDPKDGIFLALAKALGAWLVTGNYKYFRASARHGVMVIGPEEFLEALEDDGQQV